MGLINNIYLKFSSKYLKDISLSAKDPMPFQYFWFKNLIENGKDTLFGKDHNFSNISSIEEFQKNVPIRDYNATFPYIERLLKGEDYILWNEKVKMFAKSSGTSSDKSKFIPVTQKSLEITHYGGFKTMLSNYINSFPCSKLFKGKALTLGGSVTAQNNGDIISGDLSALLLKNSPRIVEILRTPSRKSAMLADFNTKLEMICKECAKENVTNFSGVPSWNLMLLNKILEYTGEKDICKVWPNLELFMHGGIGFDPYREIYKKLIPNEGMKYVENYNASEGYFAFQDDLNINSMLVTANNGVFYEFIPMDIFNEVLSGEITQIPTLKDVKVGVNYAIVISTIGGLWRYLIGDCVKFTSVYPHRLIVSGRTQLYINAFGEELMIENAEKAISKACRVCDCNITDFTVAPVFMKLDDSSQASKGYHKWAIEFSTAPADLQIFTQELDKALMSINSDYEAKRTNNSTMNMLEVVSLPKDTFYKWMQQRGKVGGQNKVPRLYKDETYINQLVSL
jgi:GH3 auxin-responsive promoter.